MLNTPQQQLHKNTFTYTIDIDIVYVFVRMLFDWYGKFLEVMAALREITM